MTYARVFGYQPLGLVLIHVFFAFLIWENVSNLTGALLAIQANSSGGELTLRNLSDKIFLELLFAPAAAMLLCILLPGSRQQTKEEGMSVNIVVILVLAMSLAVLLPLNMSLHGTEGLILSMVLGFLSGVLFRPIPALLFVLSLSASTFLLIGLGHDSFFAVVLGLIYQNTLLFGVGFGLIVRFLLKKLFFRT